MESHLYYYTWHLEPALSATVMDDLLEQKKSGRQIYFLSCNGCLKPCWTNKTALESKCRQCRFNRRAAFSHLDMDIRYLNIEDYVSEEEVDLLFKQQDFTYTSVEEIKEITYKGVKIGYGALSTYVSSTRNREPVIDSEFKNYFNQLLRQGILLKEAIDGVIKEINPSVISIFNGRTADVRAVYDTALMKNISLRGIENIIYRPPENRKEIFHNAIPQSIRFHTNRINELWENSPLTHDEKEEIATDFYTRRRGGHLVRDVQVYIKDQKQDESPDGWDPEKKNIVIFNSSEDEVAAIPEYDELSLFHSQEKGLEHMFANTNDPEIHFYLRVHPNLKDVPYGYHNRLHLLGEKFEHVTVIPGNSPVSTYRLMDEAEKVVVFSSTMGAEASFWRKPVITIHGSNYYHLDVGYIPEDEQHLITLLESRLEPKPRLGSLKYGYYQIDFLRYSTPIRLIPEEVKLFGKVLGTNLPHLKWLNSSYLFKIYSLVRYQWIEKMKSAILPENELEIPKKGY